VYWFLKTFDLFGFPVDALWWKLVHQRASTGKPNKSKAFGNQYTKEDQQESQNKSKAFRN
jgi:hypothetical protein